MEPGATVAAQGSGTELFRGELARQFAIFVRSNAEKLASNYRVQNLTLRQMSPVSKSPA
jgi:hypothetical protein